MTSGKFIVVEGGDGAGKDTQIALMQKEFPEFVYTREPGGTELGQTLRNMVLHESHGKLALLTELFLFLADRAQHVEEVILPALREGKVVVSNRSWLSFMAYQVHGRDSQELEPLARLAVDLIYKDCPIDVAVILDVPAEVGVARQKQSGKAFDVMENMSLEARERIRQAFLQTTGKLPGAKIIDANRSVEAVWQDVKAAVQSIA